MSELKRGGRLEPEEKEFVRDGAPVYAEWERRLRENLKAEGKAEGKAELLVRLLERRFGPLTAAQRARVRRADEGQLDAWSLGIFEARGVADLLKPSKGR